MRRNPDDKSKARVAVVAAIAALFVISSMFIVGVSAQETVQLGTAEPFAILAHTTVTNTGGSVITGDIGLHPGTSVTGFGDATVIGNFHIDNEVAEIAKADLFTAYNDAAGRAINDTLDPELGGKEVLPGVYKSNDGTFEITNQLTLNAENNTGAVWIFQMASTLTTAVDSSVLLINGAQACNVFWQVGSSATINGGTTMKGTVMSHASVSMKSGASLEGRAMANTGAVTLIENVITVPECLDPPVEDPPVEDPPTEDPPTEDPPTEDPPTEDPPTEDPPTEDPPTEDPPTEDPPTEDPPGDDPPGEDLPLVCSTNLMASANGDTSITLTWNDIEGAEQYRIYRAVGGGAFALHGEVDGDVTSFTDMDTEVGITYGYEVRPVVAGVEAEECDRAEVTAIPFFPGLLTGVLAMLGAVAAYPLSRRRT